MATSIGQYTPVFLPGEIPSQTEKPGRPQSTGLQRVRHYRSDSVCLGARLFCPWQLCPSESWAWRWCSCLACGDPGSAKCAGTRTASATGVMTLSAFFQASYSWWSEGLFGQSFLVAPPVQALGGLPCLGVVLCSSAHQSLKGAPWVGLLSVVRCPPFDGPASLLFSCQCWRVRGERLWWWPHSLHVTQQYRLAPMAAQLSSIGISHHNHLLHIPRIHLSASTAALAGDCSTVTTLQLPAAAPSGVCMAVARTVGLSFHLGCHRSAVSLSALNVSPLTQTVASVWGSDPCFSSPTFRGQVQSC